MRQLHAVGKIVMECVIETNAILILQFLRGLRGDLHVTLQEGTSAAWLYDLIQPHVTQIVVCDSRRNALLNAGSKSDRIDARKLAELLYLSKVKSVYHGEHGVRTLKELVRSYLTISKELARVMTRVEALYRSWAIPCTGKQVYSPHHSAWKLLCQIPSIGPIRAAVLIGLLQTPHRFRTKRQLWTFSGFGIETHSSADYRYVDGQP